MQVAVVQLCSGEDVDANMAALVRTTRAAHAAGARLIALPENAVFLRTAAATKAPIQPTSGAIVSQLRSLAEELGIWLLLGSYPEASDDPQRYHNTSVLIDGTKPGAPLAATYRKIHLFDVELDGGESHRESDKVAPGDRVVVADLGGICIGLSICYDLRFPQLYQRLVGAGARIVAVPAAFTEFTGRDHWMTLLRARAIETQTFVIAPNQWGHHGGSRRSYGRSAIIDPWGTVLATAADGVGFASAWLDFAAQDRIRASLPCLRHARQLGPRQDAD